MQPTHMFHLHREAESISQHDNESAVKSQDEASLTSAHFFC
jgi:hypothetical protein